MAFDTRKMLFPEQIEAKRKHKELMRTPQGQRQARAVLVSMLGLSIGSALSLSANRFK